MIPIRLKLPFLRKRQIGRELRPQRQLPRVPRPVRFRLRLDRDCVFGAGVSRSLTFHIAAVLSNETVISSDSSGDSATRATFPL